MHTFEELERFRKADRRHLFAAYRDGRDELYYLEDGTAEEMRQFTKTELMCAIPDCAEPRLTTVALRVGRQHFRHAKKGAGNHAPESEFHLAAKGIIQRWARAQDATVTAGLELDPDGTRQRRTDVLVEWPDGTKVAFEPQYSNVNFENWSVRHDWYEQRNIPDVWLFGHVGRQFRNIGDDPIVKLSQVQLAAARTRPILWINPQEERVATLDVSQMKRWDGKSPIRGQLRLIPVEECTLTRTGLTHPVIERCHQQLTDLIAAAEAPAPPPPKADPDDFGWAEALTPILIDPPQQQKAWERGVTVPPRRPARTNGSRPESPPRAPVDGPARYYIGGPDDRLDPYEDRNTAMGAGQAWLETPDGQAMTSRLGGVWPTGLPMWPVLLPLPTHHWQGFIYERFVLTCTPGDLMDEEAVTRAILEEFTGKELRDSRHLSYGLVREAVKEWHQHAAGVLIRRISAWEFTRYRRDEVPPLLSQVR